MRLGAEEGGVLADDDARDAVEEAGARAHVAGRERRVHGGAAVGARGQPARGLQGRRLAVVDGRAGLHAQVVAAAEEGARGGD